MYIYVYIRHIDKEYCGVALDKLVTNKPMNVEGGKHCKIHFVNNSQHTLALQAKTHLNTCLSENRNFVLLHLNTP